MSAPRAISSLIFPVDDLAAAKAWWTTMLGREPYFDEPFYVGFDVDGYEIGLNPGAAIRDAPIAYLLVDDIEQEYERWVAAGCEPIDGPAEVGDGIALGALHSPDGQVFGLIENPNFGATERRD